MSRLPGDSSKRPTCQVSARAPACCQAKAASSSQFVPGARRTRTRGLLMGSNPREAREMIDRSMIDERQGWTGNLD